jgi:hypothetical protein
MLAWPQLTRSSFTNTAQHNGRSSLQMAKYAGGAAGRSSPAFTPTSATASSSLSSNDAFAVTERSDLTGRLPDYPREPTVVRPR